jgi:glycerol-3-phosphate acyltransferase PlsX
LTHIIAIDAMGGEAGPAAIIEGLRQAARGRDIHYLISGPKKVLAPHIEASRISASIIEASSVVSATRTFRENVHDKETSMHKAAAAVSVGAAQAVVSAGDTQAYALIARRLFGRKGGANTTPYATSIPTAEKRPCVVLDLGVQLNYSAEGLARIALQGEHFARVLHSWQKPLVGLVHPKMPAWNEKGEQKRENVREAARLLEQSRLQFRGYIDDIMAGEVHVAVMDGNTGNIFLKMMQGQAKLHAEDIGKTLRESIVSRLGALFARRGLNAMRYALDPNHHNGAMFLGLNGVAVKSHGKTNAVGFASAIGVACKMIDNFDRLI